MWALVEEMGWVLINSWTGGNRYLKKKKTCRKGRNYKQTTWSDMSWPYKAKQIEWKKLPFFFYLLYWWIFRLAIWLAETIKRNIYNWLVWPVRLETGRFMDHIDRTLPSLLQQSVFESASSHLTVFSFVSFFNFYRERERGVEIVYVGGWMRLQVIRTMT